MNTAVSFIVVLGVLIFVHELGHFLFAKLFRVRVLKFSLGFGPKLLSKTIGETEYLIAALPLGGYVKMLGEQPDEQAGASADRDRSFAYKSVWNRFFIVFAGPLFNLLFAVVLFFFIFIIAGVPKDMDTTVIGAVSEESPAFLAGLKPGDEIISINDIRITEWQQVFSTVKDSNGEALEFQVVRERAPLEFLIRPSVQPVQTIFKETVGERYMVGIVKKELIVYERVNPVHAFTEALAQTWTFIYLTGMGVVKIFQKVVPASELGGPILIAQLAGEQARAGWINFCYFMGLLSVNLGLLNLLPVPVLDGGHLVFLTLEGIRRKPLNERAQIVAQQIGIALLVSLMVFVFYNDIVRVLTQWRMTP